MPRWLSSAPRKKLPPPTTIATSTVRAASAISRAIAETTSGFTPSAPAPNASPESFSITLRLRSVIVPILPFGSKLVPRTKRESGSKNDPDSPSKVLRADLEASEVAHREARVGQDLLDLDLVVLRVVLLEQ